jgi:hypothetical protein
MSPESAKQSSWLDKGLPSPGSRQAITFPLGPIGKFSNFLPSKSHKALTPAKGVQSYSNSSQHDVENVEPPYICKCQCQKVSTLWRQ